MHRARVYPMEPDRREQIDAFRNVAVRVVLVVVPLVAVAALLRTLGLPWWLIAVAYAVFGWIVITD